MGLTQKEYAIDSTAAHSYPEYEIIDGEKRYDRVTAIPVTDEEYEHILTKTAEAEAARQHLALQHTAGLSAEEDRVSRKISSNTARSNRYMVGLLRGTVWDFSIWTIVSAIIAYAVTCSPILTVLFSLNGIAAMTVLWILAILIEKTIQPKTLLAKALCYTEIKS